MPPERLGVLVDGVDVPGGRLLQLGGRSVNPAPDLLLRQIGEEALDLVEPRGRRRGEVNMPARTPGEPVADRLRLVGRVVVHDDVDLEVGRHVGLDVIQELAELRAAVAPVALSDDLACGDVKGCEQRGGALALVVMGAPLDLAGPQRQQGLGAIQGLNLRLLVHAENHGVLRRVHVQPDDVARLVHEVRVCRELEGLAPVRLKGKGSPDAIDRRRRIPRRLRHRARAPLGRVTRLLLKRLAHHLGHSVVIDAPGTAGARLVVKPVDDVLRTDFATSWRSGWSRPARSQSAHW